MRPLRPERLFPLESGLWVLDAVQPVAAVLDPGGGVGTVVSWQQLAPPSQGETWPAPVVLGEGAGLWVQHRADGALVRVDQDGVRVAVWTGGLVLATCGPGTAWCAPPPPGQELVQGPDARPGPWHPRVSELLGVDEDGGCTRVRVPGVVRSLRAGEQALLVEVDRPTWSLHHLGADTYEVIRPTSWLALPWDVPVPPALAPATHALPQAPPLSRGPGHRVHDGGRTALPWYRADAGANDSRPLRAGGLRWRAGWPVATPASGPPGGGRELVASAHAEDGAQVARWDLGPGRALAAAPLGRALALAVGRRRWPGERAASEVVALDPARQSAHVLLGEDSVDIGERCWPLVAQPLEVRSYLDQQLRANSSLEAYWSRAEPADGDARPPAAATPLVEGMREVRTAVVGGWPHARLEWTFAFDALPGLVLRRRVPLFDEVGRTTPPQHADIHLMEDLETGALPPPSAAVDGVLDV